MKDFLKNHTTSGVLLYLLAGRGSVGVSCCGCPLAMESHSCLQESIVKKSWGVDWTDAMGYFDPINLAKYVPSTCHVTITRAGLGDYTCPPSGLAILYNNLKSPKTINWMQNSTHGYIPPKKYQKVYVIEQK